MHPTEFHRQVLPLKGKLFRFAKRLLGDQAAAEDVVQEVLVTVWERWADLRQVDNLEAWTIRATRNKGIDYLRSRHRRTETLENASQLSNGQPDPEALTVARDTMKRLQQLMADLPEKQRLVMHLRDVEHYSYQEICNALDLTMAQVKINLFRARKKMRQRIMQTTSYGSATD